MRSPVNRHRLWQVVVDAALVAAAWVLSWYVRFDGDTYEIEGMVKLCMFYDPDGNSYMLAQSLSDEIPS